MRLFHRRSATASLPHWLRVQHNPAGMEQLLLEAWVVYDALQTRVVTSSAACLKIMLSRRANDPTANRALVRFLAQRLGIASAQIAITAGGQSAKKTLSLLGVSADTLISRLSSQRDHARFILR